MKLDSNNNSNLHILELKIDRRFPYLDNDENYDERYPWREHYSLNEDIAENDDNGQYDEKPIRFRGGRKRRRSLQDTSENLIPGMHYVDMFVGNPAQRLTFAVSTNSDHTIFPCTSECPGQVCGGAKNIQFESSKSSSFEHLTCDECTTLDINDWSCSNDNCILEGSLVSERNFWSAYQGRDFIHTGTFGNPHSKIVGTDRAFREGFQFTFACQLSSSGFVDTVGKSANGILGLSTSSTSFVHQMFAADKLAGTFFSMCFHRTIMEDATSAGTLILGGYDAEFHTTPMSYIKNTREDNKHYTMKITNIYLRKGGGESVIPISPDQEIIKLDYNQTMMRETYAHLDSASPYTLLDKTISKSFQEAWTSMTSAEFSYRPMDMTEDEMLDLPTIMIQLLTSFSKNKYVDPDETPGMVGTELDPNSPYDVLLAIPPQHYTEYIPEDDKFRIRLSIRNSGGSVIGANALQGRHLNFDLISPRIGIAETTKCAVGKKDKPKIPNTPPPVPTIAPTSYMDIQVDFDDIFSSTPSMQPSSKASLLSGTSHSELAIIFSDNSFSYGYFYFIGFGVVGVTLVLVVFMSLVSSPDDQQRFNGEKESLVRTSQPLPIHASFRHMKNRATRGLQRKPTYSKQGNGVRHQRAESPRDYDF